jgi:hypothetical protein
MRLPSIGRMRNAAATQPGVKEYTATFIAWELFFSPPKLGARALMINDTITTPTMADTKLITAAVRPNARPVRPKIMLPIREALIKPATAPMAASGTT